MSKIIVTSALISVAVIGLSGCGSRSGAVNQLSRVDSVTIVFPKKDPLTMDKFQIRNGADFSTQLRMLSDYEGYKRLHCSKDFCDYKGLKVNKNNNIYTFNYVNETLLNSGNTYSGNTYTKTNTLFNVHATQVSNTITFNFPLTSTKEVETFLNASSSALGSEIRLETDMKKIFSKLNTIPINKYYALNEEINSKYPAQSIYANFKRMIGKYSYRSNERISESKKANTFNLKVNGQSLPLHVEVFPYRDGSKVKYSTELPYKITSNGSNLTKQDIENIKVQITEIVND